MGQSRKVIAEMVGDVSESTVKRWEEGTAIPDLIEAAKLARFYSVSVDYLADDAKDEPGSSSLPALEEDILRLSRLIGLEEARKRLLLVPRGAAGYTLETPERPTS